MKVVEGKKTHAQEVAVACLDAFRHCTESLAFCLSQNNIAPVMEQVRLLSDAADVNLATSNFLMRSSPFFKRMLELSVEVNTAASDGLSPLTRDHMTLKAAYAACLSAAESCRLLLEGHSRDEGDARDRTVKESFPASDVPPPPSHA